jgi:hypothetical protein
MRVLRLLRLFYNSRYLKKTFKRQAEGFNARVEGLSLGESRKTRKTRICYPRQTRLFREVRSVNSSDLNYQVRRLVSSNSPWGLRLYRPQPFQIFLVFIGAIERCVTHL